MTTKEALAAITKVQEFLKENYCSSSCKPLKHRMFGCVSCAAWKVADSLEEIKNDLDGWVPDPKIEFGAVSQRQRKKSQKLSSRGSNPRRTTTSPKKHA